MASPCGANCSFTLSLDVPYFECKNNTFNITIEDSSAPSVYNATWEDYVFNATTYSLGFTGDAEDSSSSVFPSQAVTNICTPARAYYTLDFLYENNIQSMNVSVGTVTLLNMSSPAPTDNDTTAVLFPGFMASVASIQGLNQGVFYKLDALNWTAPFASWYRDLQLMAFIDSMCTALAGEVLADPLEPDTEFVSKLRMNLC
jgi:hypothetical protein